MKKRFKLLIIFIIIILLIPVFISTYYSTPLKLIINDTEYVIYQDTEKINLISYNTNDSINITKKTRLFNTKIDDNKIYFDKMISIPHQDINSNNKINLSIKYITGKKRNININIVPSFFPDLNIEGNTKLVGDYYISTTKDNTIFNYQIIINEQGKIKYYKQTENKTMYFTKQVNKNNETRYTYIEKNNLYILDNYFKEYKVIPNVEQYIYYDDNDYIICYDNHLKRITNNETIWDLEIPVLSMSIDYDNNLLLVSENNLIKKINVDTGKNIWTINNTKGTIKLTKKQPINNPQKIISTSKNVYCILTDNKQIIIKINPTKKRILSYKSSKTNLADKQLIDTNNYLTTTIDDDITIVKDKDMTININYPISSVFKK